MKLSPAQERRLRWIQRDEANEVQPDMHQHDMTMRALHGRRLIRPIYDGHEFICWGLTEAGRVALATNEAKQS